MIVNKGHIIYDIIEQNRRQYSIPVYQRNYDWTKTQCEKLLNDIIDCVRTGEPHFVGSIVNARVPSNNKIFRYVIVDGQQRLTTIFLLLKALYDCAESELDKEQISNWMFNTDKFGELDLTDETKLKLKPIKSDNVQLNLLMKSSFEEMDKASNIYRNYEFLKARVENLLKNEFTVREICNGIEQLICAIIELEACDKPQEVFESINSTGQPLSIADLIRNFVLMTDETQDYLYENYWVKIEGKITKELMPNFLIDYLNFKQDGFVKESDAYDSFKSLFKGKSYSNETMLKELLHYATIYSWFLNGAETLSEGVNNCLNGFRQIKQTTIYVFLFNVFDDYLNGVIDEETLHKILKFFLNYSIRRLLCNVGSNSLRALYKYLYSRVFSKTQNLDDYYDAILSYFYQLSSKDALIKDEDLKNGLLKSDLYHKNAICKYVLYKLENFNSKEIVDVKNLTIEHIMPQNEYLNKPWKEMLGEKWSEVHSTYLHTLGNLTLTGYNGELSDKSFSEKKELLLKANTKVVILNKDVLSVDIWNEAAILSRAKRLGGLVAEVFELEVPSKTILFRDENLCTFTLDNVQNAVGLKPVSYTLEGEEVFVDDFKEMMESVLLKLYNRNSSILERIAKNDEPFVQNSKQVHISCDNLKFKYGEQLADTGIYYNTNLSAPSKLTIIKSLLNEYDINLDDFAYSANKPKKT